MSVPLGEPLRGALREARGEPSIPGPATAGRAIAGRGRDAVRALTHLAPWWPVWVAATLVVLARLPFLTASPGPDEGGFLAVASQWRPGGTSLYGSYWVDRPPLLIALYQLAAWGGGVPALRLIGCVASGVTVLAVGWTCQQFAGHRAALASSVVAAVLLGSPLLGSSWVNGELLAAPFTAGAIALAVAALAPASPGRARWCAAGVGGCVCAALLVKQNLGDAVVFAAVAWLLAWRRHQLGGRRLGELVAASLAGVALCAAVVAAWTLVHGTSLIGVYDAMYPFRVRASHLSAVLTSPVLQHRLDLLVLQWVVSAVPLLMVAFGWAVLRGRLRRPVAPALLATMVFASASIAAGGSFWSHYLVELVVPVALASGLLAAVRLRLTAVLIGLVTVLGAVAWGGVLVARTVTPGAVVGTAIARSAHSRDTLVSVLGEANVLRTSGLRSPYPYLWALPARVLDPRYRLLRGVLSGRSQPTWVVAQGHGMATWLQHGAIGRVVRRHYRSVGRMCGKTVYLHDGLRRRPLDGRSRCASRPSALTQVVRDWHAVTGSGSARAKLAAPRTGSRRTHAASGHKRAGMQGSATHARA